MIATDRIWRQGIADRNGTCLQCGKPIYVGASVGFAKSSEGYWVRAHEHCIPPGERNQTTMPVGTPEMRFPGPPEAVPVPKGLQESESIETALLSIADSLNRLAKESMRRNDLLEAIEFLMRK